MMTHRGTVYSEYQLGMLKSLEIEERDIKNKLKILNKLFLNHKKYCKENNWKIDNDFIRYVKIKNELRILNQRLVEINNIREIARGTIRDMDYDYRLENRVRKEYEDFMNEHLGLYK